jgi:vancomycin resistance protein YoaR
MPEIGFAVARKGSSGMRLLSRESEAPAPASRRRRAPSHRRPRPSAPLVGILALCLASVLLGAFRLARHGSLPHLRLSGISVGGLDQEDLRKIVSLVAATRAKERVTVIRAAADGVSKATTYATRQDLGYDVDLDATVQEILHRGRQRNPLAALTDHVISTFLTLNVRPVDRVDARVFDAWISETVQELSIPAREGDLRFTGATVEEVDPGPGMGISRDDLREEIQNALQGDGAVTVTMTPVHMAPKMSLQAVKEALADARYALSGPVRLLRGKRSLEFTPRQIGQVLEAEPVLKGGRLVLELVGDPAAMKRVARNQVHEVEIPARDARFVPTGDGVAIVPSKNGIGFDSKRAAIALVRAATSPSREAKMKGLVIKPELSTREARALHIDQQVSSFTTYYQCCPPRVTNIHRIADMLDGSVVKPGEVFSVNAIVGERTPEKGFVLAPGITEGQIVDQLGGGISQFGTTIFNAVFFGGYQFVEFQHHSYYFTRYPAGRDATISWTSPDFAFKNDSKFGVYIDTSYTDTSVTVTFYGHKDFDVDAVTTGPYNFTDPPTQCKVNKSLPKGAVSVTQTGSQGFDILVKRAFQYDDGTTRTENFFTHYKPEPMIVETTSCSGPLPSFSPAPSP